MSRERGIVYIIDNHKFEFDDLPPRESFHADNEALFRALRFVGYREESICRYENQTADEMVELMKEGEGRFWSLSVQCCFLEG